MLKCFCPVIFRLEWLSAFCEIFKRCFLSFPAKVFNVFPSKLFRYLQLKYSKYFPPSYSGICRCFATICWARTSAWASQSSGSHIRWWFISQTSPFSSTFYINQPFRFILHWISIFVMDSLINFASKISDVTALPQTQRLISLICLWTKCNYKFFRHLPRSPKKWDVSADTKGNPSCHS